MQEDYLHYVWEYQKWKNQPLRTTGGGRLEILSTGRHNFHSGPDFFNARLVLDGQEWAGNVEIHLRSSDWYVHRHEQDPAYDNVILHVVWDHDLDVYRKDSSVLPVLELKKLVDSSSLKNYESLTQSLIRKWINCEGDFQLHDDFVLSNWLERLYLERLEAKSVLIIEQLHKSAGNWEEVLFKMLVRNFGLNINGDAFLSIANSIPFSVLRKVRGNLFELEAVLMGQAGLLEKELEEVYYKELQDTYRYLSKKFKLSGAGIIPVKHFRLRPDNFPEIRLAQLASVYHQQPALFSQLLDAGNMEAIEKLFYAPLSDFWNSHYTFSKAHTFRRKKLSRNFINLLLINSLVPVKFAYQKHVGREDFEGLSEILQSLHQEDNQIIEKFNELRPGTAKNAMESQALLQLKKEYCDKNRCLHCALGIKILQRQK